MMTRWHRYGDWRSEMSRLHDEMNRIFDRFNGGGMTGYSGTGYPPLNMWGDDNNFYVEAEIPGLDLQDLELFVNSDNQLSIKVELKSPDAEAGTWHRRERSYGEFTRVIELPGLVDSEQITANLSHGVLKVTLPKRAENKPRRIEVKSSD
jgi:HSP20 family protein